MCLKKALSVKGHQSFMTDIFIVLTRLLVHFQDLFFKYSLNTFLHSQVEQCIATVLTNTAQDSGSEKAENILLSQVSLCYSFIWVILC